VIFVLAFAVKASCVPIKNEMLFFRVTKNLRGVLALVTMQSKNHAVDRFQLMVGDLSSRNRAIAFGALEQEHMNVAHWCLSDWTAGF
jgi:hypothetical protein